MVEIAAKKRNKRRLTWIEFCDKELKGEWNGGIRACKLLDLKEHMGFIIEEPDGYVVEHYYRNSRQYRYKWDDINDAVSDLECLKRELDNRRRIE